MPKKSQEKASMFTKKFVLKRWLDFRRGHTKYFTYLYSIAMLILLVNLTIDLPMYLMMLLFIGYMPIASLVGLMDRVYVHPVETTILFYSNPKLNEIKDTVDKIYEIVKD